MSDETGGLDLSHVTEIPGGDALQGALNNFNKKAAGAGFKFFKRILGTVTEPFFRVGMGERYYTRETHCWGIGFWIVATIIALLVPHFSMLAWPLCELAGIHFLAPIFQYRIPAIVAGGFMVYTQWRSGRQGFRLIAQYRNEGNPYHTRSRGVGVQGASEIMAFIGLESVLLLCNLPCAGLFLLGYMMNAKIKAEQDAAILSRYLDTLDAEVENQYLESAALGTTPTEITYLNKPLPKDMSPQMRNGVAASMVGKPVMGIGKRRQPAGSPQGATRATASATAPAANYLPPTSSAKTASSAPARGAMATASPAKPARSSRQGSQGQTTSTRTEASQPQSQVFSREMLAFLKRSTRPEVVAELVKLKATAPTFPSDEVLKAEIKDFESTILLAIRARNNLPERGQQTQAVNFPMHAGGEFSETIMAGLKQHCEPGLVAKFVELKATSPDFPCDTELMCRIGGCRKAAFFRGKDYQAVAERILKHEMTPEVTERMDYLLRHETEFHFVTMRFTRNDIPSSEEFKLKVAACPADELKRFNNLDERVEMVLNKN